MARTEAAGRQAVPPRPPRDTRRRGGLGGVPVPEARFLLLRELLTGRWQWSPLLDKPETDAPFGFQVARVRRVVLEFLPQVSHV